ncbi:MAG: tetratricopeptide repeat protein [Planctomycetota bacterium]
MRKPLVTAALLLPLLALPTGCTWQTHDEVKEDAAQSYFRVRSALMIELAEGHFNAGQLDEAERVVSDAAQIDPSSPGLYLLAGRIALERGQLERSTHYFDMAAALDEKDPEPHYYTGVVLQRWKQPEAALAAYAQAHERRKDDPGYVLAMSEMLVASARPDDAIALLESKAVYFDQNAGLRAALGHLYTMQHQASNAVRAFEEAALLDPDNPTHVEELAQAYLANGQDQKAADTLEMLLEDVDETARIDLRRTLVAAYARIGRIDAAKQVLLRLARAGVAESNDWVQLGRFALKTKDADNALFAANRVIRLDPERPDGYMIAGLAWKQRNVDHNALTMFDRAAQADLDNPTPLVLRGIILQKAGKTAAARDAYQKAAARAPQDPRAQKLLAALDVDRPRVADVPTD